MSLFIRITLGVAAVVVAFVVLAFVLKILIFAAVVAALVVGASLLVAAFHRGTRKDAAVMTYTAPR